MDDSFQIEQEVEENDNGSIEEDDGNDYNERVELLKRLTTSKQQSQLQDFEISEESYPDDLAELQQKIMKKQQKKIEQRPKKQSYVPVNEIRTAIIIHLFKLHQQHNLLKDSTTFGFQFSNFSGPTIEKMESKFSQANSLQEKIAALHLGFALTFQVRNTFTQKTNITLLEPANYIITFGQLCRYYDLKVRIVRAFDISFLGLEQKFKIKAWKKNDNFEEEQPDASTRSIFEQNSTFLSQEEKVESLDDYAFQLPKQINKKKKDQTKQNQIIQINKPSEQDESVKQTKKKAQQKKPSFKQINDDIANLNQHIWLEFYDETAEQWVSFDPISDRMVSLDIQQIKNKLHHSFSHFIMAAQDLTFSDQKLKFFRIFGDTFFVDITHKYAFQYKNQRMQLSLEKWFNDLSFKTKLIFKGLPSLVEEPIKPDQYIPSPESFTNEKEFKYSMHYAIASQLSQYQMIHPEAKPIGVKFKDEDIYKQSDVIILHSKDKWREYLREVKPDAQPIREVSQKFDKNKFTALYALWQTNDIKVSLEENNGNLPINQYQNYETFSFPPPKGTKLLKIQGIKMFLTKNNFRFAEAVDGFDSQNGRMFAQKCGYLVYKEDYDNIIKLYEQYQIEQAEKNKINRRKELLKQWSDLLKSILLKRDLSTKYQMLN